MSRSCFISPLSRRPARPASRKAPAKASLAVKPSSAAAATHSTMGTVKSIDIAVGSHVAARYKDEGSSHPATAVTVREATNTAKSAKS